MNESLKKKLAIAGLAGGLLLIAMVAYSVRGSLPGSMEVTPFIVKGHTLNVQVAKTDQERAKGLAGRMFLGEDEGMLFVHREPNYYQFWMKDMKVPVDLVWIGVDGIVVDITHSATPGSFPQKFSPRVPAQFVLEVSGGFAAKNQLRIGDHTAFAQMVLGD